MKDIPGYENQYAVEENGDIWSHKRKKYLTQKINTNGYIYVCIWINGKTKTLYIHKALALTYIENPENLPTVDHIDRNKQNNSLSNLRWASYSTQNKNHTYNKRIKIIDEKTKEKRYLLSEESKERKRKRDLERYYKNRDNILKQKQEKYKKDKEIKQE